MNYMHDIYSGFLNVKLEWTVWFMICIKMLKCYFLLSLKTTYSPLYKNNLLFKKHKNPLLSNCFTNSLWPFLFSLLCRMAARCFWDADTDNYAQDIFMNVSLLGRVCNIILSKWESALLMFSVCLFLQDSLFCVAAAFGSYYYWGPKNKMTWPEVCSLSTALGYMSDHWHW